MLPKGDLRSAGRRVRAERASEIDVGAPFVASARQWSFAKGGCATHLRALPDVGGGGKLSACLTVWPCTSGLAPRGPCIQAMLPKGDL